jgi:hypothetical protein
MDTAGGLYEEQTGVVVGTGTYRAALMFGGAAAQDARGVLQAMDKATGASKVNSIQYNGTGWISFIGQNFSTVDDWPRVDLKSYTATIDYENKAGSEDYIRVQGKNPPRGGGAGFPIQGESRVQNFVNGVAAWTLNGQGQPQAQDDQAEIRQFMMWVSPHGFIKAAYGGSRSAGFDPPLRQDRPDVPRHRLQDDGQVPRDRGSERREPA